MASQPSAAAKTSRWGSFLTGLESKLDTILADDDVSSKAKANDIESEAAVDKAALVAPLTRKATPNSMDLHTGGAA